MMTSSLRPRLTVGLVAVVLLAAGCHSGAGMAAAPASGDAPAASAAASASPPAAASPATALPVGVLASIPLDAGSAPLEIATGYGSVWVGTHRASTLYRIDPVTDTVAARIDLGQDTCSQIALVDNFVFVGNCDDGTAYIVIDPKTNQVVKPLAVAWVAGMADGGLWVTSYEGTFAEKLDPVTLTVEQRVAAPGDIAAVGGGFVWVGDEDPDTGAYLGKITKIDPRSGRVVATLATPATGVSMDMGYAPGVMWLHGAYDDFLVRVDTATGTSTKVALPSFAGLADFGDEPPLVAMRGLWLRVDTSHVLRLDERTGKQTGEFPADLNANGGTLALGFGSLWVANFDTDSVWRVEIAGQAVSGSLR